MKSTPTKNISMTTKVIFLLLLLFKVIGAATSLLALPMEREFDGSSYGSQNSLARARPDIGAGGGTGAHDGSSGAGRVDVSQFGRSSMLAVAGEQSGDVIGAVENDQLVSADSSILTIKYFQNALERFPDATRLIIVRDGVGAVSIIKDESNNDDAQNKEIIDELRRLIPGAEKRGLLDYNNFSSSSSSSSSSVQSLSSERLSQIFSKDNTGEGRLVQLQHVHEYLDSEIQDNLLTDHLARLAIKTAEDAEKAVHAAAARSLSGMTLIEKRKTENAQNAINMAEQAYLEADKAHHINNNFIHNRIMSLQEKQQAYIAASKSWETVSNAYSNAIQKSNELYVCIDNLIKNQLAIISQEAKNNKTFWDNQVDKIDLAADRENIKEEKEKIERARTYFLEERKVLEGKLADSDSEKQAALQGQIEKLAEYDKSLSERGRDLDKQKDALAKQELDLQGKIDSALTVQKTAASQNALAANQAAIKAKEKIAASEEKRKAQAKEIADKEKAGRQAIVDAKKSEMAPLFQKWVAPVRPSSFSFSALSSASSSSATSLENWKYPAASDARDIVSSALEATWNHLANFQMIDLAREAAQYPQFFSSANSAQADYKKTPTDGRSYNGNGGTDARDRAVNAAHKKAEDAERNAMETYAAWMTDEFHTSKKDKGVISPIIEAALFEGRSKFQSYRTSNLKQAFIQSFNNVWPGVIQAEELRQQRIFALQNDGFKASDEAWNDYIQSTKTVEDVEHLPTRANEIKTAADAKKVLALAAEDQARNNYAVAVQDEARNASSGNEHARAAGGAWGAMIHKSAEAVGHAVHDWEEISKGFVNGRMIHSYYFKSEILKSLADNPINEIEYHDTTRKLDRTFAIAEANLAAWKAAWSDEFQSTEVAQAKGYYDHEMSKIVSDQNIHQLGTAAVAAKDKYLKTFEGAKAKYVTATDATRYQDAIAALNAFKAARIAFEKAKVLVLRFENHAVSQLRADQAATANRVNQMSANVQMAYQLYNNSIFPLCNNYNRALEGFNKAEQAADTIKKGIHHWSTRTSPKKYIRDQFASLDQAEALIPQKKAEVTTISINLKAAAGGSTTVHNASSAWHWAWQNILRAHYNLAMAEVELEIILSKLARLGNK